jgi:hypothetical protein
MSCLPTSIPLPVQHYATQGDVARLDLLAKLGAYLEIGAPLEAFYGYVYFEQGKWRAGYSINRALPITKNFEDMREGFDWVVAAVPAQ